MSQKIAELYARIFAKDELTPTLNTAKGGLASFGGSLLKGVGGLVGITSAAAVAGLAIKGFKLSLDAAAETETTMARLNATLQATGREAEISAGKISRMAESLMETSTFDDEAIINAYNALAKFNSVPTDGMEAIVKAAMDMTAALGGDLAGNAEAIGKLLESGLVPRTWGFSEALKESIKQMLDAGDKAGALEIVIGELNKRFGGQAAAQLNTYNGSVLRLKTSMGEFWEAVGDGLVGPGKSFNEWLSNNVDGLTEAVKASNKYDLAVNLAIESVYKEVNLLTHNTLAWELHRKELDALLNEYLKWMTTAEIWQTWLDNQPTKIDATTTALADLAAQEEKNAAISEAYLGIINGMPPTLEQLAADAFDATLANDGLFDSMDAFSSLAFRHELGLVSDAEVDAYVKALNFKAAIDALQSKHITITIDMIQNLISGNQGIQAPGGGFLQPTGGGGGNGGAPSDDWDYLGTSNGPGTGSVWINKVTGEIHRNPNSDKGWAQGGSFIVPPGFPNDSFPMRVQSGEHVQVTPAGAKPATAQKQINLYDDAQLVIQVGNGQTIDDVVDEVMDKMR